MSGNAVEEGRTVTHKVSSILLTFAKGGELSMTEIAKLTGLPISTAHRLMTELASLRLLERTPDGLWRPGLSLRNIGSTNVFPPSLAERAPCILEDLAETTKCRVRLGVWRDTEVAYIEKRPESVAVTSFSNAATVPAHPTALGRVLLAFSSSYQVERVIAHGLRSYTEHTMTHPARLRHALAVTRLTRVAVTRREFEADIYGVAMPVFGPGGHVVAGIEITANNLDDDLQRGMPPLLIATRSLSRELAGGVDATAESTSRAVASSGADELALPRRMTTSTVTRLGREHGREDPQNRSKVLHG
jgi:DNA-binding IclR family transcriptional regulator